MIVQLEAEVPKYWYAHADQGKDLHYHISQRYWTKLLSNRLKTASEQLANAMRPKSIEVQVSLRLLPHKQEGGANVSPDRVTRSTGKCVIVDAFSDYLELVPVMEFKSAVLR